MLGDQILGGLGSQFRSGHCGADLEIVGIHVLEGRNVFLNGVYRSRAYFEIVDVHGGFVVALKVQVYLGNVLGEAELHVGECCPVAVAGLCLQIAVVAFAAGIGVFHAQIDRVVPLGLCCGTDSVLHAGFALVVQQELRAVPVFLSVADAHGVRAAVCLRIGCGNGFYAASAGECRNIAVLEVVAVDLCGAVVFCRTDNASRTAAERCRYRNCCTEHHGTQHAGSYTSFDFFFHECVPPCHKNILFYCSM